MQKTITPIDNTIYVEREYHSTKIEETIDNSMKAQKEWANLNVNERVKLLKNFVEDFLSKGDVVGEELTRQIGRPISQAAGELNGFKERADYMLSIAETKLANINVSKDNNFKSFIKRRALGIVFVIAPWNYPYMTAINTVAPALIAGNTVVLKHASQTLLVGERMAAAFQAAGIPEAVFQNVFLDHATTSALIAANSFGFVNFTGSVSGGRAMEHAAAGTFTGLGLELGGKDPGYVMEDADLDAAAETLIDGAMFNSGQCCCGIERIYVSEALYKPFVEKAVEIVSGYQLGNPLDPDTTLGPMAHLRFADEVRAQTAEACADGAKALIDPALFPNDDGAYLMPQILTDVDHTMRAMRDESFGPLVGIMKVKDDAEAVALMNDSNFGLTAALWTQDYARAEAIADEIDTGTVFTNRCDYLDPALCWTGCKDTGRGGGLSQIGFHNLTRPKSYHMKKA